MDWELHEGRARAVLVMAVSPAPEGTFHPMKVKKKKKKLSFHLSVFM